MGVGGWVLGEGEKIALILIAISLDTGKRYTGQQSRLSSDVENYQSLQLYRKI
jgi:hypothetical protein